jgi:4-amino-4-deoxy-L-arabinose transferase-like glycosyltransferase
MRKLDNNSIRYLWTFIFLLAASLWSVHINRPVDLPTWHEFDYASIARNFVREGNNIFYPRIDWRGDGPGFTEMEFPIVPWIMAQLYRVFGTQEIIGRLLSCFFMLLSLAVLRRIAMRVMSEMAAIICVLFFVVSHEITIVATAIQPESLMLLCYLLAVYLFLEWYQRQTWLSYALAILSFSAAMLVKSPAAHLGIFFMLWALTKDGMKALRKPSLYAFALLSLVPVIPWYLHASSLWHEFHNSMGVSNEDHLLGLDILKRPKVIANLLSIDVLFTFGGGGLLVALATVAKNRFSTEVNRLALTWCIAITIYFVVIMRTAAGYWASYYHVVAVPPIALLFGAGVYQLRMRSGSWRRVTAWCGVAGALLIGGLRWLGNHDISHMPGVLQDLAAAHSSLLGLLVLTVFAFTVTVLCLSLRKAGPRLVRTAAAQGILPKLEAPAIVVGCFVYFVLAGQLLLGTWKTFETRTPQFTSAQCLRNKIAPNALIVTSGGICFDAGGHRVANDAPNMFYWLDHKGFTTCQGHESIEELRAFAKRGGRYFVADKASLADQPGLEAELRHSVGLLADCDTTLLFDLNSNPD